jgi:spore germination cell wall hydrolase CwlJ-like protein
MFKKGILKTLFSAAFVCFGLLVIAPGVANAASYKVVKGDSLYTISKLFNTSVSAIQSSNNIKGTVIYPGQVLNVPAATYTVKSGDSLYLIAKKHGISLDSLRKANNKWDDMIYPGQTLVIPGTSSTSAGTSSGTSTSGGNGAKAVVSYSESDVDLLARLIRAEAESQPYEAQVAVGAVVINRVQSDEWPNTIKSVIYQKIGNYYQFSPVENGWINRPATDESKKAAYAALYGSDPSNGAIFYFDDSTTNKWIWSRPIAARIGRMVYTY